MKFPSTSTARNRNARSTREVDVDAVVVVPGPGSPLSTMVKVLSDVNGWVVPMLVRARHDPTLWNVAMLAPRSR